MKIALACDHAGFTLKTPLAALLQAGGHQVLDLGPPPNPADDYPDFALAVGQAIQSGQADRGVLLCGSGVGACVAANKLRGVRAGVCHDTYSARQGVEHDNVNVLCLGARIVGAALAEELVTAFITARFNPEERHLRRLRKVEKMEEDESAKGEGRSAK